MKCDVKVAVVGVAVFAACTDGVLVPLMFASLEDDESGLAVLPAFAGPSAIASGLSEFPIPTRTG